MFELDLKFEKPGVLVDMYSKFTRLVLAFLFKKLQAEGILWHLLFDKKISQAVNLCTLTLKLGQCIKNRMWYVMLYNVWLYNSSVTSHIY